jgi:hypothetical protein
VTQLCPTCGKELDDGVRFCPHDGTPLTETAAAAPTPTGPHPTQKVQPLQLPVVIGTRYRLTQLLGGGGMAKVYRATDVTLEREVAVKLINPELRAEEEFDARFQREARIASQLADPHIVVVHDFGLDPVHGPYLVMEYLQGQSLRERLATGPLPLKAGLQLSAQLFLALIHAHDKGIVHRDIKPDNIFLLNVSGVRLHVRVLDFGIARIYRAEDGGNPLTITHPGAVLGTPRYMSPEQLAGQPVDARSDLYSAAVVIHEALTGQLPYVSGKKLIELCPEATPVLQDLLDQCLRPNPKERPANSLEVYLRLMELGKASGILLLPPGAMDKLVAARQAHEPTVAYVPPKAPRWRRRVVVGAVLALALIAALLAVLALLLRARFGKEELLGLKVGDTRDDVVVRLGKPEKEVKGDPWAAPQDVRNALGHVLRPEDLGGDNAAPGGLDVLLYWGDALCVVLRHGVVRAIVVRGGHKALTGRGMDVGDSEEHLVHAYASELQTVEPFAVQEGEKARRDLPEGTPAKMGKLYRYGNLGIGFEVIDGHVTAITLYPASP